MIEHNGNQNQNQGPVAFVIFGVTGDLTRRKLIPALYELKIAGRLPAELYVIGFARRDWSDDHLRETLRSGVEEFARTQPVDDTAVQDLLSRARYVRSSFDEVEGYQRLRQLLDELNIPNVMYYLATPPESYVEIIRNIGETQCNTGCGGWTRLVVEKPYGQDLESARFLEEEVHKVFREEQVYRIDHYLGK